MKPIRVLAVTSEIYPLVKTGGLADVTGALPLALTAAGVETVTLVPGYPAVLDALKQATEVAVAPKLFGGRARLLRGQAGGLALLVIDAPHLYARPGNPYTQPDGQDWPDNAQRFAALGQMAARVARDGAGDFLPDILHAHDWQAGLAMAYLHFSEGRRPASVMTVHNLAFQGLFPGTLLGALDLPAAAYTIDGVEFHGMIGFLKAGLALADRITTVSPSYAAEILMPAAGMGLDGLLRARGDQLSGILNGIDDAVWNPSTDGLIAARFNAKNLTRRRVNKRAVQERFGLEPAREKLLLGVISRLTWQKGLDLLIEALPVLRNAKIQLAVLGTGEPALEAGFAAAAAAHPGTVGCVIGYDEALAHQMQAGLDALLVPSRFEPCGLTQLCALRYGTLPVVARVGGLADTVIDANEAALAAGAGTGVQFSPEMLPAALGRLASLWRAPKTWRRLQVNAMKTDVSWRHAAERYAALYQDLMPQA